MRSVWSVVAEAVTCTFSVTAPTFSMTSTRVAVCAATTTPIRTAFWNPGALIVSL